jgi:hypothetical protein
MEEVNKVFHTPNNLPWICNSNYEGKTTIPYLPSWLYLACYYKGKILGVVVGIPSNSPEELQVHLAFYPSAYGKVRNIGKEVLQWLQKNTDYLYFVGLVNKNNEKAKALVLDLGFKFYSHSEHDLDAFIYKRL